MPACRSPAVAATSDRPQRSDPLDNRRISGPDTGRRHLPRAGGGGGGTRVLVPFPQVHIICQGAGNDGTQGPCKLECSVVTPLMGAEVYLAARSFLLSPPPRRKHRVQTVGQWDPYSGAELRTVLCVPAVGGHGFPATRALTRPLRHLGATPFLLSFQL